jgi:hypothetical protein
MSGTNFLGESCVRSQKVVNPLLSYKPPNEEDATPVPRRWPGRVRPDADVVDHHAALGCPERDGALSDELRDGDDPHCPGEALPQDPLPSALLCTNQMSGHVIAMTRDDQRQS